MKRQSLLADRVERQRLGHPVEPGAADVAEQRVDRGGVLVGGTQHHVTDAPHRAGVGHPAPQHLLVGHRHSLPSPPVATDTRCPPGATGRELRDMPGHAKPLCAFSSTLAAGTCLGRRRREDPGARRLGHGRSVPTYAGGLATGARSCIC